jgi:hypothetical protein
MKRQAALLNRGALEVFISAHNVETGQNGVWSLFQPLHQAEGAIVCSDERLNQVGGFNHPPIRIPGGGIVTETETLKALSRKRGIRKIKLTLHWQCAAVGQFVSSEQEAYQMASQKAAAAGLEFEYISEDRMVQPTSTVPSTMHGGVALYVLGEITRGGQRHGFCQKSGAVPSGSVINYEKGHEDALEKAVALMIGVHMDPKSSFGPFYGREKFTVVVVGMDNDETIHLRRIVLRAIHTRVQKDYRERITVSQLNLQELETHCKI